MSFDSNYSKKVTDTFIELCESGKVSYDDELRFFDYLKKRYKPITLANFAKGITRNYRLVQKSFDNKELAGFEIDDKVFVYNAFN